MLANLFGLYSVCDEADLCCLVSADQRILHQGAEETLPGLQQHRRLHLHVECHHVDSKAQTHMEQSSCVRVCVSVQAPELTAEM